MCGSSKKKGGSYNNSRLHLLLVKIKLIFTTIIINSNYNELQNKKNNEDNLKKDYKHDCFKLNINLDLGFII